MEKSRRGVTAQLAEFAVAAEPSAVGSGELLQRAAYCLLDWYGCALGASRHRTAEVLMEYVSSTGGTPQADIIGHDLQTDAVKAAMVNGTLGHVHDFDDTHLKTVVHPSGPVAAALLAAAQLRSFEGEQVSSRDLLEAFVVGYEVETRVGLAIYPDHYDRGWHITGTVGGFGAAAAVGRLLDIEPGKLAQALSLSATQAGGLREMFGTMTKPFHPGRAAANGLLSVLLVNRGFTSSSRGLEAPRGFLPVVSEDPDYAVLTEQLGETWQIRDNAFKPYPCGVVTHPVIDGVLRLRRKHQLSPQEVASVTARVHPLVVELTGKEEPETGLEGKFSVYHCAAAALVDGVVLPAQFTDERVQARELAALRERVRTVVDDELREDEAVVELETAADSVLREHVEHATGSKDNPMTAEQLISKFLNLAVPVVGERDAELLVDVFLELPDKEFFEPAVLR